MWMQFNAEDFSSTLTWTLQSWHPATSAKASCPPPPSHRSSSGINLQTGTLIGNLSAVHLKVWRRKLWGGGGGGGAVRNENKWGINTLDKYRFFESALTLVIHYQRGTLIGCRRDSGHQPLMTNCSSFDTVCTRSQTSSRSSQIGWRVDIWIMGNLHLVMMLVGNYINNNWQLQTLKLIIPIL